MAATNTNQKPIFSTSSSSSSWSSRAWTFDVFLSFRGEDTRKNFTGHLYAALTDAGVNAFIDDDQLPRGENISKELMQAIQGSRISIVVFSRSYGDSRWCLEELVEIMECRRTLHHLVLPIFYDVDPADVRKQTGSFAEAFERHERRFIDDKTKVMSWREALVEAANLSGWDLRNTANGHEAKFIKQIVQEVLMQLKNTHLFVALYPVGINFRVEGLSSTLAVGLDDEVRIVGIWGLGGIGKTTIAKAIYNKFFYSFEGKSFLANVREIWNVQPNERVHLQEQLLCDILKGEVKVGSIDRGMMVIKQRLCNRRVLIVIDDVDHIDQLNAIARSRDWFGPGSRIIVTTRDRQLLEMLEVDSIYEAEEMNENESLELFSWHAFRKSHPSDEKYVGLSRSIVAYCSGLPLALEVLGSFLFRRSREQWLSALEKLKSIPNNEIKKKLRISFDGLDDDRIKDIFLDISCFFIRMDKNYVLQILDGCDLYAEIGISILLQRCLLTINVENKLMMHDLIRDMGTDLVRETCPKEPGKWSRLWLKEDIFDVVTKHTGTETIEGLTLSMERHGKESFSTKAFEKMQRLRLLQLNYVQLTGSYGYLSKAQLRWLCWHGLNLKFIPNNFYQPNLVFMDLQHSNLKEVWKHPQMLEKLKILNLSHSHYLTRVTADFSKLPSLTELILKDCKSLYEIHHSIGRLDRLVLVDLEGCKILKNLPKHFYNLKSVETLNLSGCSQFENLDEDIGEMVSLQTLLADNTKIRKVPFSIVQLKNLKHLSLCGLKGSPSSKTLTSTFWSWLMPQRVNSGGLLLPSLQGLNSLTTLRLRDCNLTDDGIPEGLGSLRSLVSLDLQNNNFRSLPSSLSGLSKLFSLYLDNCTMLQSIPDLPASLFSLFAQNCTALQRMPNMSEMPHLCYSVLTNCHKLVDIPGLDKMLTTLKHPVPSVEDSGHFSSTFEEIRSKEWQTTVLPLQAWQGSFILPGDDIPVEVFPYVNEGSSVHFEVTQTSMDHRFKGLQVCFLYSYTPKPEESLFQYPTISVINYTQGDTSSNTIYHNLLCSSPIRGNHIRSFYIPNNVVNFNAGDKVQFSLELGDSFAMKKIGVRLEWELINDVEEQTIGNGEGDVDARVLHDDQDRISEDEGGVKSKRGLDNDAGTSHNKSIGDRSSKRLRIE